MNNLNKAKHGGFKIFCKDSKVVLFLPVQYKLHTYKSELRWLKTKAK